MKTETDIPIQEECPEVDPPACSDEMLAVFGSLSILERLMWLDETYAFLNSVADEKTKQLWKQFRAGELK